MNLMEAKKVLHDRESTLAEKFEAVRTITQSEEVSVRDLVDCLQIRGVCAEMAAMRLHLLTGRERSSDGVGVYLLPEDWVEYIDNGNDTE